MEIAGQDAELPEIRLRTKVLGILVVIGFLGLVARLFYLQVIFGETFYRVSSDSLIRTVPLEPARGEVRDRRGRVLATTRPYFDVQVAADHLTPQTLERLRALLETPDPVGPLEPAAAEAPRRLPSWEVLQDAARSERDKTVTLVKGVSQAQMAAIATSLDLPGVFIHAGTGRYYQHGPLFSHLIGYLNEIGAEELQSRRIEGYRLGDLIGRTGLERQWESHLRGKRGFEKVVLDRRGRRIEDINLSLLVDGPLRQEAVPGHTLHLTLDLDAQEAAARALEGHRAAAMVALEVKTGRVLVMLSVPGFDPNRMTAGPSGAELRRIWSDPFRPLRDKTRSEIYNPGSTFKSVSAITALEEGLVAPHDRFLCRGSVHLGRHRFGCTHRHGAVDLAAALVQSCNVYFYSVGLRPGAMDLFAKQARGLGLGEPTGLALGGEAAGLVPTVEYHRAPRPDGSRGGFSKGHALNTSIGEGATRVTVLQLARLYAAIANGGELFAPQIVERIETAEGEVVERFAPRLRGRVAAAPETLARVRAALVGVVNDPKGTAYRARSQRVPFAGKTGTAHARLTRGRARLLGEPPGKQADHAWFAGYAPHDNPQIAFAVLVENGGYGGAVAAPVARTVIEALLDSTRPPAVGSVTISSPGRPASGAP